MAPRLLSRTPTPNLAIRDSDPGHTFQGHDPEQIANALAVHAHKMAELAKESSASSDIGSSSYQGHHSSEIAQAIQSYVVSHQDSPWSQNFAQPAASVASTGQPASNIETSMMAVTASSSNLDSSSMLTPAFSISALVHDHYWMSVFLCIIWILSGLFMLFFGWASFFWGCNLGMSANRVDAKAKTKKPARFGPLFAGPPIAGGVGGILVGFLSFSFLSIVVTAAICVSQAKSVTPTWLFLIWLLPGLLGAFFAGHWLLFARAFTGLLSGACLTLIVTAMFGIHTLIIRAVFIGICTSLITAPLLLPRRNAIHFHLLNICTSIIGAVTFLDGVALFAPSRTSSGSWIDLWVLLFAIDGSASEASASKKWGTSAFKGFVAGAVLSAAVGFLFEFFFHKHAAEDPDMEWNNYLGTFTQRLENHDSSKPHDRAGSFEPAPSAWHKFSRAFATPVRPAAYGNISDPHDLEKSPLTHLPGAKKRRQARRSRTAKIRGGPAKFEALSKDLELADTDSDATDYDSDSTLHKLNPRSKVVSAKSILSKADADELADELKPLSTSGDTKFDNSGALALPRPPSYRTNSSNSRGSNGSGLSGKTVNSASEASRLSSSVAPAEKSLGVYRDRDALSSPTHPSFSRHTTKSPPPPFPTGDSQPVTPLTPSFPATPSLVNAIARIQAAQAQAKAWYETRQDQDSTSAKPASSGLKQELPQQKSKIKPVAKHSAGNATTHAASPPAQPEDGSFQSWWGKQVKGDPKPST